MYILMDQMVDLTNVKKCLYVHHQEGSKINRKQQDSFQMLPEVVKVEIFPSPQQEST